MEGLFVNFAQKSGCDIEDKSSHIFTVRNEWVSFDPLNRLTDVHRDVVKGFRGPLWFDSCFFQYLTFELIVSDFTLFSRYSMVTDMWGPSRISRLSD